MENGEEDQPGLSILNAQRGDFKVTFDKDKPGELERAEQLLTDLFKRGYTIVVQLADGTYKRVRRFNAKTFEYIIRDVPKDEPVGLPVPTTPAIAVARTSRGCAREAW